DPNPGRLAVQLAVDPEALALAFGQGVDKTEPGIVPGPCVLGAGIAQPDDESKTVHRVDADRRPRMAAPARCALLLLGVLLGGRNLGAIGGRSEEHTSELQSRENL